jgi:hydroxymethylpyrimidine pyrophosphatase-like HAD family hydrolase
MTSIRIYLSAGTDAVDAALITKDLAVRNFASDMGIPLPHIAVIGDSANDIPLLKIPNLGLVGAPNNAQLIVKQTLETISKSHLSNKDFLDGFMDFYAHCIEAGIAYVFADRDGVLIWKEDLPEKSHLREIIERMGQEGRPFITIVTGSSYDQNMDFVHQYGLNSSLASNERIRENPYVIYAENGAVQINILDGSILNHPEFLDRDLLRVLKTDFFNALLSNVEKRILPIFNLEFSKQLSDERSKIYLPPKKAMVTLNIPREHHGIEDYHRTPESDRLRHAILKEMVTVAQQLGLPYEVLGVDQVGDELAS